MIKIRKSVNNGTKKEIDNFSDPEPGNIIQVPEDKSHSKSQSQTNGLGLS